MIIPTRKGSNTSNISSGVKQDPVDFNDAAAGVYRYMPSDWSLDLLNAAVNAGLPLLLASQTHTSRGVVIKPPLGLVVSVHVLIRDEGA